METVTEEINRWIAEHGSERNALNIALSRLESANALIAQLNLKIAELQQRLDNAIFQDIGEYH